MTREAHNGEKDSPVFGEIVDGAQSAQVHFFSVMANFICPLTLGHAMPTYLLKDYSECSCEDVFG